MKARPAVKKASNQVSDVGFTDQDVAVQLADAKALRNNSATRTSQSMVIVVDDDEFYEPTDVDIPGEPVNESKLSPSKRRSPVAPTDERKSRSVGSLPFWAQAKWDLVFVPTLLDLAGRYDAEDGGWEIEKNKDMFVLLLQDVADIVYPNVSYAVHPTSNMYHLVSVYNISQVLVCSLFNLQSRVIRLWLTGGGGSGIVQIGLSICTWKRSEIRWSARLLRRQLCRERESLSGERAM